LEYWRQFNGGGVSRSFGHGGQYNIPINGYLWECFYGSDNLTAMIRDALLLDI
jgi:hypothetical protein